MTSIATTVSLQSDPDPEVQVILTLGILAGLVLIFIGFRAYRVGRLIKNTPTEKVRSAAVGRTELFGTAIPKDYVIDRPFTDGKCLYASYKVEEYREYNDDDKNDEWKTIFSKTLAPPFYLDDGTGRMLINADSDASFEIGSENSYKKTVRKRRSPPQKIQEFLGGPEGKSGQAGSPLTGSLTDMMGGRMATAGDSGQAMQTTESPEGMAGSPDQATGETGQTAQGIEQTGEGIEQAGEGLELDVTHISRGELNRNGAILERPADDDEGEPGEGRLESTGEDDEQSGLLGSVKGTLSSVSDAMSSMSGPRGVSPTSRRKRRYTEEILPVGEDAYVFGSAEPRVADISASNADRLVMEEDPATGKFIISDRGEDVIAWGYTKRALIFIVVGLIISAASLGILAHLLGF